MGSRSPNVLSPSYMPRVSRTDQRLREDAELQAVI
jgi:hypothetical protein